MRHSDEIPVMLELLVAGALPGCAYALQLGARELDQVQVGDGKDCASVKLLVGWSLATPPGKDQEVLDDRQ